MISGTLRHEGAVVAEDQEPLVRAFGQVEHQAIVPPGIRMGDCAVDLKASWQAGSGKGPSSRDRDMTDRRLVLRRAGRSAAGEHLVNPSIACRFQVPTWFGWTSCLAANHLHRSVPPQATRFLKSAVNRRRAVSSSSQCLPKALEYTLAGCPKNRDHLTARDDAPATEVVKETLARIDRMRSGSGGKLVNAAGRLINELRAHPDPIGLVEETRKLLPSATIDSERGHPTYQLR